MAAFTDANAWTSYFGVLASTSQIKDTVTRAQLREPNFHNWILAEIALTSCESSCISPNWFTQAPWVASLDSDVVLSKGVKSRNDHFMIWVSHTSCHCLVCGWGCIDVVYYTNIGSSGCRWPGNLDGVCRLHVKRQHCWGCQFHRKTQNLIIHNVCQCMS